jgi:hypothetical protein
VSILVEDYCEFLYVGCCLVCLELLPDFIVCLCGIFMGAYSGTVVIGYGDIVTVYDMLGLVFLMVGLMWQMCQGQHVDVCIFNSMT